MEIIRQEIRYAFRSIAKTPLASTVIVATLAMGIALVTTFFSLINTAFYRPLPYRNADRIISLNQNWYIPKRPVLELARVTKSLERITMFYEGTGLLSLPAGAIEVRTATVDSSFFPLLETPPILGTLPTAIEVAGLAPIVVINERLWRTRLRGQPDIIGRLLKVDGVHRRVVAVMPRWFTFRSRAQVWYPLDVDVPLDERRFHAAARLATGARIEQTKREIQLVSERLRAVDSSIYRRAILDASEDMVDRASGQRVGTLIVLVVGSAVCVLLVACTNVASLMLARAARRRGEIVVRSSLGASRWQLMRPQLIESMVLATTAGIGGTLLSIWGIRLALGLLPATAMEFIPGWAEFGLDGRVLGFAAVVSMFTVLIFGLWPAREGTRVDLTSVLRSSADSGVTGGDPTRRLHLPVVLQLTLSLGLLVGAVQMLRSFNTLTTMDRGFSLQDRYRVYVAYDEQQDSIHEDYTRYVIALRARLQAAAPGTQVALSTGIIHFPGDSMMRSGIIVPETGQTLSWESFGKLPQMVSDNYFRTLGLSMLAGREFDSTDVVGSAKVAIVSRSLAMATWGSPNVVGKTLVFSRVGGTRVTVVGVVSDITRANRIANGALVPSRDLYLSERQGITCCNRATLLVHSRLPAGAISALVNNTLRTLGRDLPVTVWTLKDDEERGNIQLSRMLSIVLGTFALAGLVMAVMGIYGVVAFSVEQRTREIGVRVALGATPTDVIRHVMAGGLRLVLIGMGLGLAAAAMAGKVLRAVVVGTLTAHIVTAVGVCALFGLIALIACYLPARRSARLDPLMALRSE